ncbi:unnamed protein product, partial [Mesorhabditis belari]|uniref:G-protein coupled receptors family 1 profile domain-containing protein n=1 Tax=Mesorhabditis belari TaxID=2138241 RepID=A0AAF3EZS7_9BILA
MNKAIPLSDFFDTLEAFSAAYGKVHHNISLFICVFGVMANVLHITILTRPIMKRSAVNRLLAFMAIFDTITMVDYLLYLICFGLFIDSSTPPFGYQYLWICYLLAHVVLSISLHSISMYLSVATAFIRLIAISRIQSKMMRPQMASRICIVISLLMAILIVPTFYVHQIVESVTPGEFKVALPQENDIRCQIFILNLWLTGMFFKVIPCLLLMVFTVSLLYKLHLNKIAHEKIASKQAYQSRSAQSDRTTMLLILLLVIFTTTEMPQGLLALLNALYTEDVNRYLYSHLGDFFDLLSLINGSMCFVLYPCISTQYRQTFSVLFARLRNNYWGPYKSTSFSSRFPGTISECRSIDTTEYFGPSLPIGHQYRFVEYDEVNL